MTIRRSNAEDGPRAVEIWRAAVDATHHFLSPQDRADIDREVQEFLPAAPLWLAVDASGETAGFLLLDEAHIDALFIHPAYRGAGVGRALVEFALTLQPSLTTDVNEQNSQAVGFYQHLGFVPTGRSELDGQGRPYPLLHMRLSVAPPA